MLKKCFLLGLSVFYIGASVFAADSIEPVSSTNIPSPIRLSSSNEIIRPSAEKQIEPLTKKEAMAENQKQFSEMQKTGEIKLEIDFSKLSHAQYLKLMQVIKDQEIQCLIPPNVDQHYQQVSHFFAKPKVTPRILCLDGGGVRGVIEARILQYLEEVTGKRTRDLFDFIVASSTGGIIACAAEEHSMERIIQVYREESPKIFTSAGMLGGYTYAKYQDEPFKQVLAKYFGEKRLSDLQTNIIITGGDLVSSETILFSSKEARENPEDSDINHSIVDVIKGGSSAPNYFSFLPLGKGESQKITVDGGVHCNNPVAIAALVALKEYNALPHEVDIISLGTGYPSLNQQNLNIGGLEALNLFQTLVLNGQGSHSIFARLKEAYKERDCMLPESSPLYVRMQPIIPVKQYDLDNYQKENFDQLIQIAEVYIKENEEMLKNIAKRLAR